MPYNSGNDTKPLSKRVLTKFSDICKYKPGKDITIDFAIYWTVGQSSDDNDNDNDKTVTLMSSGYDTNLGRSSSVQFTGTNKKQLTQDMIDPNDPMIQGLSDGSVVEYRWDIISKKLVAMRIRNDKLYPNKIEVARDNWDMIADPIPIELMEGRTNKLLEKYHNRNKKNLFDDAYTRFITINGSKLRPNLLDIGSGRGGDVLKWINFGKIVAVEPN